MKDIFINKEKITNNELVPSDVIPKRYAVATNILCTVNKNGSQGMLIYNSEPQISNTWYPFYSTINDFYTFKSVSYKFLIEEFHKSIITGIEKDRITPASNNFSELFGCGKIDVINLNRNEYWLKYSKSSGVWTLYLFEYYLVSKIESLSSLLKSENNTKKFMPLDDFTIQKVLATGLYEGIPLVENIKQVLKNPEVLSKLRLNNL